jgi:type VI protein secretion system component Hcp
MRHLLRRTAVTGIVLAAALAAASPASAAPDTGVGTLTIPDVGSSPILSWSWGISTDVTTGGGSGGGGSGKAELSDFALTKRINPLSTELFRSAATGSHYSDVVVSVPVGGPLSPFAVEYALRQVFVKSVDQSGAGAESVESVKLAYGALTMTVGASKFGWANPG